VETFDIEAGVNVDNKGIVRPVELYRTTPFGLYMSREVVSRQEADWIESWLLPRLGLRVSKWAWRPGFDRGYDYYLDIVHIEKGATRWRATDLYLDVTVRSSTAATLEDIDEFVAAVAENLLPTDLAQYALEVSHRTMIALTRYGFDLNVWLAAEGADITWLSDVGGSRR
jgi:predicted RNA-binding protein associated with RNAse of E/G family